MEDLNIPAGLFWLPILISIFVQFIREFTSLDAYKRFIPYLCIVAGIAGSFFAVGFPDCIMVGVAIGLIASGGYDAVAAFTRLGPSKFAPLIALAACLLVFSGCPCPLLNAEQQLLLRQAEPVVTELNDRCQSGDAAACRDGLAEAARTLQILTASP